MAQERNKSQWPNRCDLHHPQRQRLRHRFLCRRRLQRLRQRDQQRRHFERHPASFGTDTSHSHSAKRRLRSIHHLRPTRLRWIQLPRLDHHQPRLNADHQHLDAAHQRRLPDHAHDIHRPDGNRLAAAILHHHRAVTCKAKGDQSLRDWRPQSAWKLARGAVF